MSRLRAYPGHLKLAVLRVPINDIHHWTEAASRNPCGSSHKDRGLRSIEHSSMILYLDTTVGPVSVEAGKTLVPVEAGGSHSTFQLMLLQSRTRGYFNDRTAS